MKFKIIAEVKNNKLNKDLLDVRIKKEGGVNKENNILANGLYFVISQAVKDYMSSIMKGKKQCFLL